MPAHVYRAVCCLHPLIVAFHALCHCVACRPTPTTLCMLCSHRSNYLCLNPAFMLCSHCSTYHHRSTYHHSLPELESCLACCEATIYLCPSPVLHAVQPPHKLLVQSCFACCVGAGGNGAIIHYRAEKGSCEKVDKDTLLLLDSGGQFDCGTTDVTRTMHFGTPTDHQKMCFTRVLQVRCLVFPSSQSSHFCT